MTCFRILLLAALASTPGLARPIPSNAPLARFVGHDYGDVRRALIGRGYRPVRRTEWCGDALQCRAFPETDSCSQGIQMCLYRFAGHGRAVTVITRGENEEEAGGVRVVRIDEGVARRRR